MAGSFRTELPTMAVASGHVFDVNEQVQSQLASLMARLEPLMGTWQGDAASSFHQLKEQWNASARELNTALRSIGDALVVNTNNYRQTEDANRQSFTGISSVLG
jgi:WXG100 family type VII secretion target